jgi:hypothetical protein
MGWHDSEFARRAAAWLERAQHHGGGWGPPRAPLDYSGTYRDGSPSWKVNEVMAKLCSVEETSLATAALLPLADRDPNIASAATEGLGWLSSAIEHDEHRRPALVGAWRKKFWYDERLYPSLFAAGALTRALRQFAPPQPASTVHA